MAFTAGGSTQGALLIEEVYQPSVVEAVYINNEFLSLFPAPTQQVGGRYVNWLVHKGGNGSVEVFTEGQGSPNSGGQTYALAQVAWTYIRAMVEITGHARDALQSGYADGIEGEMTGAANDIRDLLNTSFMGGTYGLELAVDSGSTYAGIARGSAAYFESTETAVGGVLAFSNLIDLEEAIRDNDKGGRPKMIVCPWNQNTNIYNLGGQPAIKMIGAGDPAPNYTGQTFNGKPIVAVGDMTDTVIAMLDMSPGEFGVVQIRPFRVDFQGRGGDADVYQVSTGAAFVTYCPKHHGKLTGVTA